MKYVWLVVWLPWILHFPIYWVSNSSSQLTNSYFSEGWPKQPPTRHVSSSRTDRDAHISIEDDSRGSRLRMKTSQKKKPAMWRLKLVHPGKLLGQPPLNVGWNVVKPTIVAWWNHHYTFIFFRVKPSWLLQAPGANLAVYSTDKGQGHVNKAGPAMSTNMFWIDLRYLRSIWEYLRHVPKCPKMYVFAHFFSPLDVFVLS